MEPVERIVVTESWVSLPGTLVVAGAALPATCHACSSPDIVIGIAIVAAAFVQLLAAKMARVEMLVGADGVLLCGLFHRARYVAFSEMTGAGRLKHELWIRTHDELQFFVAEPCDLAIGDRMERSVARCSTGSEGSTCLL